MSWQSKLYIKKNHFITVVERSRPLAMKQYQLISFIVFGE